MKKVVISPLDIKHLEIIRKNVSDFIRYCSERYDMTSKKLLDIAPQDYLGAKEFFKRCEVKTLDINPASGADYVADLTKSNVELIPGNYFDYILCAEVLEHTLQPFSAVREMIRVTKSGGLIFLTVPFNFRIHGPLPDCWRFTEHGLRALFIEQDIIELKEVATSDRDLMPIHYTLIAQKR